MWLSAEYLMGLLCLIQGLNFSNTLDSDAHSDPCIAKILSCDWYRQSFSLYKGKYMEMFTKIEDLNKACKEQVAFMRCISRAESFCEQTNFLKMAEEMIKSRRFPAEICRPTSPWQNLYLKEANCVNAYSEKVFVHCVDKIIEMGNLSPEKTFEQRCKYRKAVLDCSVSELQEKCGYYGGNIFKKIVMFHSLSEYKCTEFKPGVTEDYSLSSTSVYDIMETVTNALEAEVFDQNFDIGATEIAYDTNTNFEGTNLDHLENQISLGDSMLEDFAIFDFNHPFAESLTTTEYSFSDSLDSDKESQDMISDEFEFPSLPKYHYIHKNRTTFALYEDFEMGHMKYAGCGEADVFWVILSPLRSKYCSLADLRSEYSEAIFKCTIRIDAPCSSELEHEDRSKNAEIFHQRYIITVSTLPNEGRSEDMAIMNVNYLKFYPYSSMHVPEKKINLWTTQANQVIEQTESVSRKGHLDLEEDRSDIYERGNGSGQKWTSDTTNSPNQLDEDEYYENFDYYPLEEEDVYFPELRTNNIIYIEDDKGNLISLHDHSSPIYSKSVYQPHHLFRPRTGAMPVSIYPHNFDEIGTSQKKKLVQSSIFQERVSEFQDEALISEVEPDQQNYCSAEEPCDPNSEFISEFKMRPGMYILSRNIKTFDPLKGMKQLQNIPSSIKWNMGIDLKSLSSEDDYVVTPSTKIHISKSTESNKEPREDELATERSRYVSEESYLSDIESDSRYLDPDYSSCVTSAPNSDCMKPFNEYYIDPFTEPPYKYVYKHFDTKLNPEESIYPNDKKRKFSGRS